MYQEQLCIEDDNIMSEQYNVKDLPVAAYLVYKRVELIEPYNKELRSWIFSNPDNICEQYELDVRNGKALISVSDYEATRKNVLGMVRDCK